jgi:transcriptional regulator with XRE-family HTH domain
MYDAASINEAMGRARLTNEVLAEKTKLDPRTISRVRNGASNVTLPTLKKVADALSLDLVVRFEKKAAC